MMAYVVILALFALIVGVFAFFCWQVWFPPKPRLGTVKSINFTWGGDGNQVLVIDDKEYATWLNYTEFPPIGSLVRHRPYKRQSGRGYTMRCTDILEILKIPEK